MQVLVCRASLCSSPVETPQFSTRSRFGHTIAIIVKRMRTFRLSRVRPITDSIVVGPALILQFHVLFAMYYAPKTFSLICLTLCYKEKTTNQKMNAQKKKKLTQIFIPTLRIAARMTGMGGFGATA
jgi:hypothetical protein